MPDWLRRIVFLFLLAAASVAQEEDDDDIEIEIDNKPPAEADDEPSTPDRPKKPIAQKGSKKGWLLFEDKSKKYSIELPEAWNPEPSDPRGGILGFQWRLAGSETGASLRLVAEANVLDPRSAPRYWRESFQRTYKDATLEPRYRPGPHLHWHGQGSAGAIIFLQIKGNGFYVQFECAEKEYARLQGDVMAAAATFTAKVELWPAIPNGYVVEQKRSFLIARHPGVKRSTGYVETVLRAAEKRFKKLHGTPPRSDRPIVVLVHDSMRQAGSVLKEAGEATGSSYVDLWHRRIFTLPLAKGDESAARLAGAAHSVLALAKYGDAQPHWFRIGESEFGAAAFLTGKPLPFVHIGFANWINDVKIGTLDAIATLGQEYHEQAAKQSFFYVCMFHGGKYRKAYRRFLQDFAENHDPDAAFERHILPIGYQKLREATLDFASNKMRPYKPKQ